MFPQPIRTLVVAVAGALVLPALALIPTAAARGEEPAGATSARPAKPATTPTPARDAGTKVPPAVVGKWKYGSISPTTVHDAQTGRYLGNARSMGSFIELAADGSYKRYTLISVNTNGWALTTWTEEYGAAAFDPAKWTVTFTAARGKYRVTDNRVAKNNYDRPMTEDEVKKASGTLTYQLGKSDKGKPRFVLGHRDGKGSTAYEPWEK